MSESSTATLTPPQVEKEKKAAKPTPRKQPPYNVVLMNDDDHTYAYVVEMLGRLFGHDPGRAFRMAQEVDSSGLVIVDTTTFERAEFKRDQIHAYGADWRLPRCRGSMSATIQAAE